MIFSEPILEGKVLLVTGGGTGLGREIARLAGMHGAKIAITSRSEEHLREGAEVIEKAGAEVFFTTCDVREPAEVKRMTGEVLERFGKIDILVNNAAGNFIYPAEKLPLKGWKAVIDIVLNGTFYCSQIIGQEMIKQGGGQIFNILATYAWTGGPGTIHSASAKAGVLAMTRTLAVEWARYGIRVNAIAPGAFETEGARERLWPTEEIRQRLLEDIPLRRFSTPEEVAAAVLFLLSPYAAYINGECLTMDGGAWLGKGLGKMSEILDQAEALRKQARAARQK